MDVRYFLGANSASGFFSRYDQLLPEKRLLRVLKGGAGCGKSTLMKKVAAHAEQLGLRTERILCSSDPDSLDGVAVPELGYAVVDGTAPHIVEPSLCGCREAYLDLGMGYDLDGLAACERALREIQAANRACYPKATACLRAAAALDSLLEGSGLLTDQLAASLCEKEIPDRGIPGRQRTVFLSGYTPQGRRTCWETVTSLASTVYVLRDAPAAITAFLRTVARIAAVRGWDCLIGDDPLLPGDRWEHLLIPGLGLAFVTSSDLAPWPEPTGIRLGSPAADTPADAIRRALFAEASGHLRRAKEYHDLLEAACAPYVDFAAADRAALDCCAELELLLDRKRTG